MTSHTRPLAIVGANVLTMQAPAALADFTVIVRDGRIAEIGPRLELAVPEGAEIIAAMGKTLLPGFNDMHVHYGCAATFESAKDADREQLAAEAGDELPAFLANGITRVRNMWGAPFHLKLAAEIASGRRLGPRIHTTSAINDGSPPVWPPATTLVDAGQARREVEAIKAAGYEAIKIYNHLSSEVYDALIDAGGRVGLPVVGHVPFAVGIHRALRAGQRSIEHFRGYDFDPINPPGTSGAPTRFGIWLTLSDEQLAAFAEESRAAGVWNCPTLVVVDGSVEGAARGLDAIPPSFRYLPRLARKFIADSVRTPVFSPDISAVMAAGRAGQLRLLKYMHDAGAPLLLGSDCGVQAVIQGTSLHDELAIYVEAGLSPYEALSCCCRNPADFYGDDDWGRIAPGCLADMVLLDADPLLDIAATRRISGVVAQGVWYARAQLQGALDDVARRYPLTADEEGWFRWQ